MGPQKPQLNQALGECFIIMGMLKIAKEWFLHRIWLPNRFPAMYVFWGSCFNHQICRKQRHLFGTPQVKQSPIHG